MRFASGRGRLWLKLTAGFVALCAGLWLTFRLVVPRATSRATNSDRVDWEEEPYCPGSLVHLSDVDLPAERVRRVISMFLQSKEPVELSGVLDRRRVEALVAGDQQSGSARGRMAAILTHREFRRRYPDGPGLFVRSPVGYRVRRERRLHRAPRPGEGQGETFPDELLASCAEVGMPLRQPVETEWQRISLFTLLKTSRKDFVLEQELSWSMIAYCSYWPGQPEWTNRFGETHRYEAVARRLAAGELDEGVCAGTHKLYALAFILRADGDYGFLHRAGRATVEAYLQRSAQALTRSQFPNGAWHRDWAKAGRPSAQRMAIIESTDELVHATGHHLQWIAIVGERLRPNHDSVVAAARFLLTALEGRGPGDIQGNYHAILHGVRSLCMFKSDQAPRMAGRPGRR